VEYEWDEAKRLANRAKHEIDFRAAEGFEWAFANVQPTHRHGERRYIATGYIGDRLHTVVFTERGGRTRIISLRRASSKEEKDYAQA
jgi:uncharacterized DUF497 family protein